LRENSIDAFSATTFDAAPMLEPSEDTPAKPCPGGTNTPAGEYVRWIVNAKIDSADADRDREHNRETQKIDLKPKGLMQAGEKSAQRQIGDRRKCCMSAGEARGEHARRMRYKIGSGTLIG
jgi:hypothetical protein